MTDPWIVAYTGVGEDAPGGSWVTYPGAAISDDWALLGPVVEPGDAGRWDATDRTSPTAIHDGSRLVLLFECRDLPAQEGLVGLAFSDDEGATWSVGRYVSGDDPRDRPDGTFEELPGNPLTAATNTPTAWSLRPDEPLQATGHGRRLEQMVLQLRHSAEVRHGERW